MIKTLPALTAAVVAAAILVTACATSTSGTPAGQSLQPLHTSAGPTGFPSTAAPTAPSASSASIPIATVSRATPTPVTSAPTSTAPSTWSIATARKKYLAYVHPGNVHVKTFDKVYDKKNVTTKRFTDLCAVLAKDQTTFAKQLQAGHWPATIESLVRQFASQIIDLGYHYISCSLAASVAAAKKKLVDSPDTQTLANAIRAALKLPKVK